MTDTWQEKTDLFIRAGIFEWTLPDEKAFMTGPSLRFLWQTLSSVLSLHVNVRCVASKPRTRRKGKWWIKWRADDHFLGLNDAVPFLFFAFHSDRWTLWIQVSGCLHFILGNVSVFVLSTDYVEQGADAKLCGCFRSVLISWKPRSSVMNDVGMDSLPNVVQFGIIRFAFSSIRNVVVLVSQILTRPGGPGRIHFSFFFLFVK